MVKDVLKRAGISFAIASFAGLIVNMIIELIGHMNVGESFNAMTPQFRGLFSSESVAAYVNIIMYGVIGATFSGMTFIYELEKIGFLIQSVIYFIVTTAVCIFITCVIWQLHRYPQALIYTLLGYAGTHVIIIISEYKRLKREISEINSELD